jgi:hypothetical protein
LPHLSHLCVDTVTLGIVVFYLRSNDELYDIKAENMKIFGGMLSWSLGRAVTEWYDYGQ